MSYYSNPSAYAPRPQLAQQPPPPPHQSIVSMPPMQPHPAAHVAARPLLHQPGAVQPGFAPVTLPPGTGTPGPSPGPSPSPGAGMAGSTPGAVGPGPGMMMAPGMMAHPYATSSSPFIPSPMHTSPLPPNNISSGLNPVIYPTAGLQQPLPPQQQPPQQQPPQLLPQQFLPQQLPPQQIPSQQIQPQQIPLTQPQQQQPLSQQQQKHFPASAPSINPQVAAMEKARVAILLDINSMLLRSVVNLQNAGKAGFPIQNGNNNLVAAAGEKDPYASSPMEKPKPSVEYIECMRRLQANLAYLATVADRAKKAGSTPTPPIMMPPPNPDSEDLTSAYQRLNELFPGMAALQAQQQAQHHAQRQSQMQLHAQHQAAEGHVSVPLMQTETAE